MDFFEFKDVTVSSDKKRFSLQSLEVKVTERSGLLSGAGSFAVPAEGVSVLHEASGLLTVQSYKGERFKILVKKLEFGAMRARFVTSGPVPIETST